MSSLRLFTIMLLCASWAMAADSFTLAVVPDTQQEILSDRDTRFADRMRWLVEQRASRNIAAMLQVGDLVNWDTDDHIQYQRASAGLDILDDAKLPYVLAIGNHDTAATTVGGGAAPGNTHDNQRNTSTFNHYFPPSRHQILGGVFETGKIDNAWHTFSAGGLDWIVLNIELWPRAEAVAWARTVLEAHPHHNGIVVTHAYLNSDGSMSSSNGGYGDNSPRYLWEQALRHCANLRMVFSGHVGTHAHRVDTGVNGNKVHSFLQNFKSTDKSYIRMLEIDPAGSLDTRIRIVNQDSIVSGTSLHLDGMDWVQPKLVKLPPGSGSGLSAVYFDRSDLSGRCHLRRDARIDFSWASDASPAPTIDADTYSVRWLGTLESQCSETYTFHLTADDGVRLWVDNRLLIDRWRDQAPTTYSASIALQAGKHYPIKLEYYQKYGRTRCSLAWSSPSTTRAIVPTSQLYPADSGDWRAHDIGSPSRAGDSMVDGSTIVIRASGKDIWNTADQAHFVSQTLIGDGILQARVRSLTNSHEWSKAGLMIRESDAAGARYIYCCLSSEHGIRYQTRTQTNGYSSSSAGDPAGLAPYWLRLERYGSRIISSQSKDGINWQQIGSISTSLPSQVQIGLAVTSHDVGKDSSALFDQVDFMPASSN